jgi:hypothetical protein
MPNKRRSKQEWVSIFTEQQQSGLSIKAFCERQGIHLQTFRARKSDWKPRKVKPSRSLVKIEKPVSTQTTAVIKCQFKDVELACNDSVNPQWFADMVKALTQ